MPLAIVLTAALRRLLDLALLALILTVLASLAAARLVPAITGAPAFVVGGGSMEPTIPLGALVVDQPVAATDLAVGDVVSVKVGPENAVFTHRVARLVQRDGALWIETKGDANPTVDPSIIPATAILGRVAGWVPLLGYPIQLLSSVAGIAFLLSLSMVALLGAWLLESLEEEQLEWLHRRRLEALDVVPLDAAEGAAG